MYGMYDMNIGVSSQVIAEKRASVLLNKVIAAVASQRAQLDAAFSPTACDSYTQADTLKSELYTHWSETKAAVESAFRTYRKTDRELWSAMDAAISSELHRMFLDFCKPAGDSSAGKD